MLAVRLYGLSQRARKEPKESCEVVLKEHEWKSLEQKVKGKVAIEVKCYALGHSATPNLDS